ncbi:hypothetical protein BDP55DRAFT_632742 [Colletotrichum godetiae]|uniref:DUF6536 domain-containing protein n=1 Tax=Colletotrichum godetiae TaxID=1209918 RepID=A0AAJ0AMX2_9PEZI|nr:uncharacterized protein BDP55DRAFT_632742 [Colletotrichum godetiae]KAK1674671.1 hypothetical protein BDP55DRAFT_632742 [Colletotrichum godetiae]
MIFIKKREEIFPHSRWKRSALAFSAAAFVTFFVNLSFVIWAMTHSSDTMTPDTGVVANGHCQSIQSWNTCAHVAINIISTVLLTGSNYCMQCLIAPTRTEIDSAHAKHEWLDIGIPSIRNFWSIAWKRRMLWALLAMSSFPLHLLFNSVVFTSTSTSRYRVYTISADNFGGVEMKHAPDVLPIELLPDTNIITRNRFNFLNTSKCIDEYGTTFQSLRGDVILVVDNKTVSTGELAKLNPTYDYRSLAHPFDWICGEQQHGSTTSSCDKQLSSIKSSAKWIVGQHYLEVRGCYSQERAEHCKLLFSSRLCWTVIALNLVKGILMLYVAYGNTERPILNVGDAIESFLTVEDESTKTMALASKASLKGSSWNCGPQEFQSTRRRKFAAASCRRWATTIAIFVSAILTCIILLVWGCTQVDASNIMKYGLGKVQGDTIMDVGTLSAESDTLVLNVLLANTPQVIMSMIYLSYNALFTSISLTTEWDRLGEEKKGLRVSFHCRGDQRQTYFLQLPYRYSIPLTVFSGGMHWLISESIFLVNIEGRYASGPSHSIGDSAMSCGWSPIGVICVIVVGTIMVGFLLASGFRRFRYGGIPVVSSCSVAISAACHPATSEEPEMWTKALRWGVVSKPGAELPHCSFSSREIEAPVEGQKYQ